jgi:Protein of unknown function (DUF3551)
MAVVRRHKQLLCSLAINSPISQWLASKGRSKADVLADAYSGRLLVFRVATWQSNRRVRICDFHRRKPVHRWCCFRPELPWCAIMDNDGTTQCNYYTEQQCLQTLSGIGGRCILNPAGNAPASPNSQNAQGLLPLQLQNPGPPPGPSAVPPPPNN